MRKSVIVLKITSHTAWLARQTFVQMATAITPEKCQPPFTCRYWILIVVKVGGEDFCQACPWVQAVKTSSSKSFWCPFFHANRFPCEIWGKRLVKPPRPSVRGLRGACRSTLQIDTSVICNWVLITSEATFWILQTRLKKQSWAGIRRWCQGWVQARNKVNMITTNFAYPI